MVNRKIHPTKWIRLTLYLPILVGLCNTAFCQKDTIANIDSSQARTIRYNPEKGFEFRTRDNKFMMQVGSRFQFRFATPEDQDPVTFDDFTGENKPSFKINRARVKVGGHFFQPWLKYYWEYELSRLIF